MANYKDSYITFLKKERRDLVRMKEMADVMRDKANSLRYQNLIDLNDAAVNAVEKEGNTGGKNV